MKTRHVQKMLLRQIGGDTITLTSRMRTIGSLAKLVLIAEQYGYQYADAEQSGGNSPVTQVLLVRDRRPQAQARAAETAARYPNAGEKGGELPGMLPGRKVKARPEAADHVDLIKARLNFDLSGESAEKRIKGGAIGITIPVMLGAVWGMVKGETGVSTFALGFWALLMAIIGAGFVWTRKRNAKFAARLEAAGFSRVPDAAGRVRMVPPGSELPGHGNPFAGGAQPVGGGGNPFAGGVPGQGPAQAPAPVSQPASSAPADPRHQPYQQLPPQHFPAAAPGAGAPANPYAPQQPPSQPNNPYAS